MINPQSEQLESVFCDIVEKLTFMFPEPVEIGDIPGGFSGYVHVAMSFSQDAKGEVILAVPAEMCVELAANLLGMDPDDEEVQDRARDALQELLNVFTGHALTTLFGESSTCDLTVPIATDMSVDDWKAMLTAPDTMTFLIDDDFPALITVTVEE